MSVVVGYDWAFSEKLLCNYINKVLINNSFPLMTFLFLTFNNYFAMNLN